MIVAYHADPHLDACLDLLTGGAEAATAGFDVLVVDNGNAAATGEISRRHGAGYLPLPDNLGFAGGVNAALAAGWDHRRDVMLLNPDARLTPAALDQLSAALHAAPRRAAVAPALIGLDGSPQRATWPLPSPLQSWADAFALTALRERAPFFLVGAVLLLNGAALAELGGLDERYFLYSEEADWQLRARRAGWALVVVDDVVVAHEGSASSSDRLRRLRLFHASGELFGRRWYGRLGWQVMRMGNLAGAVRRGILASPEARRTGRQTAMLTAAGPLRTARRAGLLP